MKTFQPAAPAVEPLQNVDLGRVQLSASAAHWRYDVADVRLDQVDVRREALEALTAHVVARLEAGKPAYLAADPFLPYRDPSPSEPGRLFLPPGWSGCL
ncbi:MAG: hypothetical protein HYX47_10470 [Burkholderiales bacterium]|nr:hypothetical protein [Burkholderiales bacterium]